MEFLMGGDDEADFRFSNASTADLIDDSDMEIVKIDGKCKVDCLDISSLLLDQISEDQEKIYGELRGRLEEIYVKLEVEIEPVCVRDMCSLSGKSVQLCGLSRSRISQRRLSLRINSS